MTAVGDRLTSSASFMFEIRPSFEEYREFSDQPDLMLKLPHPYKIFP